MIVFITNTGMSLLITIAWNLNTFKLIGALLGFGLQGDVIRNVRHISPIINRTFVI